MRAAEGAIEGVAIDGDQLKLEVIGDTDPVGMCGSGLVDAVAQLVAAGLIDHSGRYIPDEQAAEEHPGLAKRLVRIGEERVFVLAWRGDDPANAVYLSQRDVRELQFAKAAIATGWMTLVQELGRGRRGDHPGAAGRQLRLVPVGVQRGAYRARARLALPRIVSAGNVAGEGAKMAALSLRERAAAEAILDEVEYVELSGRTDFQDVFIDQLAFPG